jgi:hypothetical protein
MRGSRGEPARLVRPAIYRHSSRAIDPPPVVAISRIRARNSSCALADRPLQHLATFARFRRPNAQGAGLRLQQRHRAVSIGLVSPQSHAAPRPLTARWSWTARAVDSTTVRASPTCRATYSCVSLVDCPAAFASASRAHLKTSSQHGGEQRNRRASLASSGRGSLRRERPRRS